MGDFYYEINDSMIGSYDSKYHVVHSSQYTDAMMAGGYRITRESDRIWREDSTGIRFVKNRYTIDYDTVDLKEFMWIKLKARELVV